jgi:hypothetical protein
VTITLVLALTNPLSRGKSFFPTIIGDVDELTADHGKRESFDVGRLGAGFAPKTLKIALKPWKPAVESA